MPTTLIVAVYVGSMLVGGGVVVVVVVVFLSPCVG